MVSTDVGLDALADAAEVDRGDEGMKASAMTTMPEPLPRSRARTPWRSWPRRPCDAVDAEVMPEHITVKATRKVTKWMPNALCAYSAAPAACGYFVTSSR